jgi:hypothetical protein
MTRLALIALALALASLSAPANATHYSQRFDCGKGWVVWVAIGPYGIEGEETREPQLIFEVSLSNPDLSKGPVQTPRFSFDRAKEELKANGNVCRP